MERPSYFSSLKMKTVPAGTLTAHTCLQVVASWNLTGLDEANVDRLFEKVKAQTLAGPQPESLKMTYLDEWLLANMLAGSVLVDDPKVCFFVHL
jgi:hypothetical protein